MSRQTVLERNLFTKERDAGRPPFATTTSQRSVTDRLYFIGVSIKGVDGVLELVLGLALLLVPTLPHTLLEAAANRAGAGTLPFGQFVANYLEGLDGTLARWGIGLVIVYLVGHGAIKVLLVVCLLMRLHKVYPVAVAVLGAFLGYEIYLFCVKPGVTLGLFILLDSLIVYLVVREYRQLSQKSEPRRNSAEALTVAE